MTLNRKVSERRALTDGANLDATWVYAPSGSELIDGAYRPTAAVEVHQGAATGTLLASEKHFFLMLNAEYRGCGGSYTGTGNEKWENAKEFRTETQTGTGTVVTVRNWQQRASLVWGNDPGVGSNAYATQHGQEQTANDPRVTWEETTLDDGKVKRVEYGYDDFNNVTSIKEYDFGTVGTPGTLLRQTLRTYGTYTGGSYGFSNNGYCYSNLNPTDSSCGNGLASDVTSIIFQRHLLLNETIQDGQGNQKAYSAVEYDNYASESNHAAIALNSGMIHYDGGRFSSFSISNQPRGNVTKTARWAGGSTYIYAFTQYDNAGNAIWSKDPNGNVSTASYVDNFGAGTNPDSGVAGSNGATFAFPTVATNAAGHVSKMQYNYSLGAAAGVKDLNGVISQTDYDNLGRPWRATTALGLSEQSIAETTYPTATVNQSTASRQLDATRWLASKTLFDGFDRPRTSWQAEDGQKAGAATFTIRTDTIYDPIGRVSKVSNPYRPGAGEVAVYTTTGYDLGGRVKSITTPDSAVVSSDYSGNTVTVTDQAGKSRKSVTDGLGRLASVYEDPIGTNALNYQTSYAYDTLDNLVTVNQGTQTRTFVYDSLKRLVSATNPESGTITYLYDADGNLTSKTDARSITATYTYDALNRNTTVTYTNDPANTPAIHRYYDGLRDGTNNNVSNSKGRLWQTETSGPSGSRTTVNSFDALGRPLSQSQQFYAGTAFGPAFTVQRIYDPSGPLKTEIYPSGNRVTYNYDAAGRLGDKDSSNLAFTGNLGDGVTRTYSSAIIYSALGGMTKEKFGTDTAIYNKLFYNVRGQLAEIRESTSYTGPTDTTWNRGAIINHYCGGSNSTTAMTTNNGNLKKQEVYIPNNEENTSSTSWSQQYDYDSLNRLQRVGEVNGSTVVWQQEYVYDRYGNRTINGIATKTYGTGVNSMQAVASLVSNRMYGPGETDSSHSLMDYDAAGNQKKDLLTSNGTRVYDAENRLIIALDASGNQIAAYTYNADGQRVRRNVAAQPTAVETWQLYGIDGELLSEYAASAGAASPQKEYGYRNGQLLITTDAPLTTSVNVALAGNGATATASSSYSGFAASGAINGDRKGLGAWQDGYWSTATAGFPAWLEVDFSGSKTISEIDVFTGQDNYSGPVEPTMATTFTIYGLSGYDVQYWNGSAWVTVSGGSISGNNKIWRKVSFAAITTSKIRVLTNASPDNYSRLTEVEAWTTASPPPPPPPRVNVALASAGATASSSSSYSSSYGPATTNDGDRGGGWNDAAPANTFPDWVQIDFSGSKTIDEIDVFTLQDNWGSPIEPTETMTFTLWGLSGYDVQYWNGTAWVTVTNGSISGNNKIWRKLTFSPITTSKIRVLTDASMDGYSRITEVEAWTPVVASGTSTNINWLVTDQLGTPRMIFDKTGSLATTKRHDYLPFGEELFATQGARTSSIGYGAADGVRQKFTSKERDNETGLDYFLARYYSSTQGRFTSADPIFLMIQKVYDPQQWNMYGYARSNPLRFVDPSGKYICSDNGKCESDDDKAFEAARQKDLHSSDKKVRQAAKAYGDPTVDNKVYVGFGAKQSTEGGEVNFGVGKDGKYDGTLHVTFSRGQMTTGGDPTALGAVVAHEGQHVRDDQNMRDRGYDPKYVITHREAERRAYGVEERYLEAETEKRNPKTGEWEHKFNPDWISTKAIDNYLDNDPKYHNLDSPIIDTSKVPRQKVPQAKPPK